MTTTVTKKAARFYIGYLAKNMTKGQGDTPCAFVQDKLMHYATTKPVPVLVHKKRELVLNS